MIIYYSAVPLEWEGLPDIHVLYAFTNKVKRIERPPWASGLFIDSGGYVAWKRGANIDIEKYHEFLDINRDQIDAYAALDSIGDEGRSIDLYDYSRSCGFAPIPVFHEFDSDRALLHYMDNAEYIGFAAINKGSRVKKKQFLDRCFSIAGRPMVHGFGFMDTEILAEYPFHSVDGTYAFRLARFGMIITPWGSLKFNEEARELWDHPPFGQIVREYVASIGIEWELLWSYAREGLKERFKACVPFFHSITKKEIVQRELF